MTSTALKLDRNPISIKLNTSNLTWRRVGKLLAFEREMRGWTYEELGHYARSPRTDTPMAYSTIRKLEEGDYVRGGPFIATLVRLFCGAFKSSGYEIVLNSSGSELRRQ